MLIGKRLFLMVMFFAWGWFVVRAVMLYLSASFSSYDLFAPSPEMFRDFFERQGLFVFFVTVYVGAGLIAADRRAHALQIYLSKPLTCAEYVAGKPAILLVVLLLVTWVPAMALLVLQVLFAGDLTFLRDNLVLVTGDDALLGTLRVARLVHHAGAVVALDQCTVRGCPESYRVSRRPNSLNQATSACS